MKKYIFNLLLCTTCLGSAIAQQNEYHFFRQSNILKPFLSEIRSTIVKTELAHINKLDNNYFVSDYNKRPFIEVHLGADIPLFYMLNNPQKLKFCTSWYFGDVLLIDMFEENTSPIINNDYFFGIQGGVIKYLNNRHIRNIGVMFIPVFHESTHIGDEFALHGYNSIPDFKRVNVSYEAWEIAAVINDPDTIRSNLLSAKMGFHRLWNDSKGYFTADTLETKNADIPPSSKNYEYYLQLNLQRTDGFLCSDRWMQIISFEANNRLRFTYDSNISEKRTWNFNIYLGWKHISGHSARNIGFFLRYYNGIIPNGQFRNTSGYQYLALSIIYN